MDNLTHTLTAVMLSRAGFNRWCPKAGPLLILSSNFPDIDVVWALAGSLTYLEQHRGFTHALASIPAMALFLVLTVRLVGRKPIPWMRGVTTASAGLICHQLMDWTNVYGIRLLLPFSDRWLRLDITNVIDVWIWLALILAIVGPFLVGLVNTEIGAKPGSGRGAAVSALVFLLSYDIGRLILHERAVNTLNSHLYQGELPRRVAAFPHFANPLEWIGLVEGSGWVEIHRINLLQAFDPTGGRIYFAPSAFQAVEAARRTLTFRRYLRFAQFPFYRVTPLDEPQGALRVEALDLRFGDPSAPRFVATAIVDSSLRVLEESYSFGPFRPR